MSETLSKLCRLSLIPRLVIFNMLSYNLREIALDHSEQGCVLRIGFCQEHIVIIVVLIVKHTQSIRKVDSRF